MLALRRKRKQKLSVDFQYRPRLSCRIAPESLNLPVIEQLWRAELRSPATPRRAWRRRCHLSTSRRRTARIQPSSYAAACRSGDSTMVAIRHVVDANYPAGAHASTWLRLPASSRGSIGQSAVVAPDDQTRRNTEGLPVEVAEFVSCCATLYSAMSGLNGVGTFRSWSAQTPPEASPPGCPEMHTAAIAVCASDLSFQPAGSRDRAPRRDLTPPTID